MVNKGMTMQGLAVMAIGILTLIVIYTIIPLVGSQLDTAVTLPATGAGSNWNNSVNTKIPTAYGLWESLGGIVKVGGVIVVVGGFLQTLRGLRG